MPGRNLGVSYLADVQMHEVRDTVYGLSRTPHWFSGSVVIGRRRKNLISQLGILLLPPPSLVSCKIALKSSSKSITSSVIPPFKTNLLEKDLNRVETMEKLTKLTVNKQINL